VDEKEIWPGQESKSVPEECLREDEKENGPGRTK